MKSRNLIILALAAIAVLCLPERASGSEVTIDHLVYSYTYGSRDAKIVGIDGQLPSHLVIPRSITVESKTYSVRNIASNLFYGNKDIESLEISGIELGKSYEFRNCKNLRSVVLDGCSFALVDEYSADPKTYNPFLGCDNLEKIEGDGRSIWVEDNVLYAYASDLLKYPFLVTYPGKRSESKLVIPANVTKIAQGAFGDKQDLTEISVAEGNTGLKAENNVLYSSGGQTMYCCPTNTGPEFTVGPDVQYIALYCFSHCPIQTFHVENWVYMGVKNGLLHCHTPQGDSGYIYPIGRTDKSVTIDSSWRADAFAGDKNLECIFTDDLTSWTACLREDVKIYTCMGNPYQSEDFNLWQKYHDNTYNIFNRSHYDASYTTLSASMEFLPSMTLTDVYSGTKPANVKMENGKLTLTDLIPGQSFSIYYTVHTNEGYEGTLRDSYGTETKSLPVSYTEEPTQSKVHLQLRSMDFDIRGTTAKVVSSFENTQLEKEFALDSEGRVTVECVPGYTNTVYFNKVIDDATYSIARMEVFLRPINPNLVYTQAGPTDIRFSGTWDEGDAKIVDYYFELDGVRFGKELIKSGRIEGLDPETEHTINFTVKTEQSSFTSETKTIVTAPLELKTEAADAASNNCAIIKASTNISEGSEGTGFEWRRYDAPQTMPSTVVMCPAYNGYLAGKLNGLSSNTYYNYRPFYKSASGKVYYGDWITFITADAYVYFDPIVYTYAPHVADDHIELLGYVMAGSDRIVEQGFEYWPVSTPSSVSIRKAPAQPEKVFGTGGKMSVRIDNFESGTVYRARTFVTTENATTYGAEVEFTAPVISGVDTVVIGDSERVPVAYYDLCGRRSENPRKGLNFILYNDGSVEKRVIK